MAELEVVPVETAARRKQFTQFAWDLYREDPHWIPPLRHNQEELLGFRPHPFYEYAEIQTFLALRDGAPCGRIAAIVNPRHNERHKEKRGFFGFFECREDPEAAAALFEAAHTWLAEKGMTHCRGPANPSLNYECGLLVEGFHEPPTFMMTYNPPYYEELITACGYEKTQDLYAFFGEVKMLESIDRERLQFIRGEAIRRLNVTLRPLDRRRFLDDVRTFLDIYNQSLVGTWGFVPLSEAEAEQMAHGLQYLIVPEMTMIAEIEGKAVGAVFGLLDFNPRIKQLDGRLYPFGFLHLLWGRRKLPRCHMLSTNVLPVYQAWGLGLVLLAEMFPVGMSFGSLKEVEFSWVLESNHLSRASLERGGARRSKTYRMYDRALESPASP